MEEGSRESIFLNGDQKSQVLTREHTLLFPNLSKWLRLTQLVRDVLWHMHDLPWRCDVNIHYGYTVYASVVLHCQQIALIISNSGKTGAPVSGNKMSHWFEESAFPKYADEQCWLLSWIIW